MVVRNINEFTPMMQQYLHIKNQHPDKIVFFRLGDFYEMFFEDAKESSKLLEIALTSRDAGASERVPMCGVPFHAANQYIEKLIDKGKKVAIVEQVEDASVSKGIVKREVVKIVTAGTYFYNTDENVYICAIKQKSKLEVVICDVVTGTVIAWNGNYSTLNQNLNKYNVKEVVVETMDAKFSALENKFQISIHNSDKITDSYSLLISYLNENYKQVLTHLKPIEWVEPSMYMALDYFSLKNLEIVETLRMGEQKGTLFWYLDKCITAMGSRYLKSNLLKPILDVDQLNMRFNFIEKLKQQFFLTAEIKEIMERVYDMERIISRIALSSVNAKEFIHLKLSLAKLPALKHILTRFDDDLANVINSNLNPRQDLYARIDEAIRADVSLQTKQGGIFRPKYNKRLDELVSITQDTKEYIKTLEKRERKRTDISTLKIGYNKVFGYYVEVSKGQLHKVTEMFGYERKQTLANAERYTSEELKNLESKILNAYQEIELLEYELFSEFKAQFTSEIKSLQQIAYQLQQIDFYYALAKVADTYSLVRPKFDEHINIVNGRHPILECIIKEKFVANDCMLDAENILLITGPNMSGKSTYMRMIAIISIMAQIGSFVPATSATIPIFDAIFTRIGASDDMLLGQSTFMVEMLEVNNALSNATKNSLIVFDEIGRGTATFDGLAIAQAILEYLHKKGSKTLFSTHYHELTDLENHLGTLKNVHVAAKEGNGTLTFYYKVKPGAVDKSYGIHVAKLANLDNQIIKRAKTLLKEFEGKNIGTNTIFNVKEDILSPIETKLKAIDINKMTPLQALEKIVELQKEVGDD